MVSNGYAFINDPWNEKFVAIITVNQLQTTRTFKFRYMTSAYLEGLAIPENRVHIDLCSIGNASENILLDGLQCWTKILTVCNIGPMEFLPI